MSFTVGIDYSMSCPAVCVHPADKEWSYEHCTFWHGSKKNPESEKFQHFDLSKLEYSVNAERFQQIASLVLANIPEDCRVGIEDYSYGSAGRVFHIAENGGTLKLFLFNFGIPFAVYPPTVIKKFGSGKGNANKEKMYEAFCLENPTVNLLDEFKLKKLQSPVSDIVDAYYICKLHHFTKDLPTSGCMGED